MAEKIYTIAEIQNLICPIAKQFGVERVYLFGSYAKGVATSDSDIDLRIDSGKITSFFQLGGFFNALQDALQKEVDVVTTAGLQSDFLCSIASEEVLLYVA